MTFRIGSRAADAAKGLAALAAVAALVVGVPAGLWAAVGWPLPAGVPALNDLTRALSDTYVPDQFLISALAVVCWLAWAQLVASLVVETVAAIRRRPALRIPLAGPMQAAAAHLVTAVLLLSALAGPRADAGTPPLPAVELVAADPVAALLPTPARLPLSTQTLTTHLADASAPAEDASASPTYTVQRFDDLWSIAERHLADPYRWTDIWNLNRGRTFDGATFRDPDLIHPGWTLDLPADATGLAPPPTPASSPPQPPPDQSPEQPPDESNEPRPADSEQDGDHPDVAQAARQADGTAATPAVPAAPEHRPLDTEPDETSEPAGQAHNGARGPGSDTADQPLAIELPSGAIVGLSFAAGIATSLAAARLHQRRHRLPADPAPGIRRSEPLASEPARRLRRAHLAADAAARNGDAALDPAPAHADAPAGKSDMGATPQEGEQCTTLDLLALGAIALSGSADSVARAIVADALATAHHGRHTEVLLTRTTADRLLPDITPFPGLEIIDSWDAVLTRLETSLIHRTRLLDTTEVADFAALTEQHPEEPVAAQLLVADAPAQSLQPRLAAVFSLGRRLGVSAVVLGRCPDLPSLAVDEEGHIHTVDAAGPGAAADLAGTRLATLTAQDAAELLAVIAAGRGAEHDAAAPDADSEPFTVQPQAVASPISATVLGLPRIEAAGVEVRTGLRSKARELLAFFLLHPQGATLEAAVEALWPDADPQRGIERFRTVLGNLRSTLRTAAGLNDAGIIDRVGERYQADPTVLDCDLWRFQAALADATTAADDPAVIAALQRAGAAYAGDLVDGTYYEWAEAPREDLRRRAVDAAARLAELHQQNGDPNAALAALDQAVTNDPYAEELYRRTMRIQADLGRLDAVRRTYRLLETRLADLDVEPDDTTDRLLQKLLGRESSTEPSTVTVTAGGRH